MVCGMIRNGNLIEAIKEIFGLSQESAALLEKGMKSSKGITEAFTDVMKSRKKKKVPDFNTIAAGSLLQGAAIDMNSIDMNSVPNPDYNATIIYSLEQRNLQCEKEAQYRNNFIHIIQKQEAREASLRRELAEKNAEIKKLKEQNAERKLQEHKIFLEKIEYDKPFSIDDFAEIPNGVDREAASDG